MRYTYNRLKEDLTKLNKELEERNHGYRFQVESRNGYSAVDLATVAEWKHGTCERNLVCGSPRECLEACENYISGLTD